MNIPILMYHSISDDNKNNSVSIKNFDNQMKLLKKLSYKSFNLKDLDRINDNKSFILTFDDGYENIFLNAMPIIKKYNFKATCFVVSNLIGQLNYWDRNESHYSKLKLMNKEQITEWIKNGFEVGSHTHEHKNLVDLKNQDLVYQISYPIEFIKKNFNEKIVSFAYPYGSYNQASKDIVKNKYKYAVTTKRSRYKKNKFNSNEIPRIPINSNDGIFKFFLKIRTFYEDIKFKNN